MEYEVILPNFGNKIYVGFHRVTALFKAEVSGFEASVFQNGELYATYSPISGWKWLQLAK